MLLIYVKEKKLAVEGGR